MKYSFHFISDFNTKPDFQVSDNTICLTFTRQEAGWFHHKVTPVIYISNPSSSTFLKGYHDNLKKRYWNNSFSITSFLLADGTSAVLPGNYILSPFLKLIR